MREPAPFCLTDQVRATPRADPVLSEMVVCTDTGSIGQPYVDVSRGQVEVMWSIMISSAPQWISM